MKTPRALDRSCDRAPLGPAIAGLALVLPLAFGCARTAPFNQLDKAQVMVLRLQAQEPPAPAPAPVAQPPALIPGIPPELQQMGQQALQGLQQVLPPGMLPPGLIPGQPATPVAPQQPAYPRWKGFIMLAQQPLTDEALKEEILDIFGDEASFEAPRSNCFLPGLGITMQRTGNQPPVDLLVSLSCGQAQGDGFRWPYKTNGFTAETHKRITQVYEKLWGPVPPGA